MDKNIFEVITEYGTNERLSSVLLQDNEYQELQSEVADSISKFNELDLTKEQRLIVDRLVSSHTASGCCYGRIAYQQGMRDCASVLVEMGLVKDGKGEGIE